LGNVKNVITGRILKFGLSSNGYYNVCLSDGGKKNTKLVHQLVACSFIQNDDNKPSVDHINNNKLDNNVTNLRWATYTENNRNTNLRIDNTTGIKGVHLNKKKEKYEAYIFIDKVKYHLGLFNNIQDAKEARINKVNQVFAEFVNECEKL
jgi:hypothetical protein